MGDDALHCSKVGFKSIESKLEHTISMSQSPPIWSILNCFFVARLSIIDRDTAVVGGGGK